VFVISSPDRYIQVTDIPYPEVQRTMKILGVKYSRLYTVKVSYTCNHGNLYFLSNKKQQQGVLFGEYEMKELV
jgi:hypothetical protein